MVSLDHQWEPHTKLFTTTEEKASTMSWNASHDLFQYSMLCVGTGVINGFWNNIFSLIAKQNQQNPDKIHNQTINHKLLNCRNI